MPARAACARCTQQPVDRPVRSVVTRVTHVVGIGVHPMLHHAQIGRS
jgi:hypothetical protein